MKVLLVKDVYKLGRAGDIKKVADGYGRNFLIPQGLAVLATAGALKQVEKIRSQAEIRRAEQNSELKGLAAQINGITVIFSAKAGETGKLYGSITTQDVATAISGKDPLRGQETADRHAADPQRSVSSLHMCASPWTSFPKSRSLFTAKVRRLKKKRLRKHRQAGRSRGRSAR